jgi:hypothetical protein
VAVAEQMDVAPSQTSLDDHDDCLDASRKNNNANDSTESHPSKYYHPKKNQFRQFMLENNQPDTAPTTFMTTPKMQ